MIRPIFRTVQEDFVYVRIGSVSDLDRRGGVSPLSDVHRRYRVGRAWLFRPWLSWCGTTSALAHKPMMQSF